MLLFVLKVIKMQQVQFVTRVEFHYSEAIFHFILLINGLLKSTYKIKKSFSSKWLIK